MLQNSTIIKLNLYLHTQCWKREMWGVQVHSLCSVANGENSIWCWILTKLMFSKSWRSVYLNRKHSIYFDLQCLLFVIAVLREFFYFPCKKGQEQSWSIINLKAHRKIIRKLHTEESSFTKSWYFTIFLTRDWIKYFIREVDNI